jgi:tRNA A-37 threonylcarbamoyl transferase component Bud32
MDATATATSTATAATTATTIDRQGGALVVRKRRNDAAGRAQLGREHALLQRLPHPGVTKALAFEDDGEQATLTLAHAGNRSVAGTHHPGIDECARIIAAVAETVADLHRLGVVHGNLAADHVVLDAAGRPVIIGFGTCASRADDADASAPSAAADVHDLGELLDLLLDRNREGGRFASMAPSRTAWRVRRAEMVAGRELRALARHATADDPAQRPSARQFAARAARCVPPPPSRPLRRPAPPAPSTPSTPSAAVPSPAPRSPKRGVVPALALLVTIVAVLAAVARPTERPSLEPAVTASAITAGAVLAPTTTRSPSAPSAPTTSLPSDPGTGLPPTRSVAPRPRVAAAGIVEHEGHRYHVGEPGDEVAIGDFGCRGVEVAVVLRPGSGEVFVFDGWADESADRVAEAFTVVPIGSHLVAPGADQQGCVPLKATAPDGHDLPVLLPAPTPPSPEGTSP